MSRAPLRIYDGSLCSTTCCLVILYQRDKEGEYRINPPDPRKEGSLAALAQTAPTRTVSFHIPSLSEHPGFGMPLVPTLS